MKELGEDRRPWPGGKVDPRALREAHVRLTEARKNMETLRAELNTFLWQTVERMVPGWSKERNSFLVELPPAELAYNGRIPYQLQALCGRIAEDLRAALDYGIMRVAETTKPDMTEKERRRVQFIIARDKSSFNSQAGSRLTFVDPAVKDFIEKLQPYNGNEALEFVGRVSGASKHHGLPKIRHSTSLTIVLQEDSKWNAREREGWWVFPAGKDHICAAQARDSKLIIDKRRDALVVLPICIDHTEAIVNTLEHYLQNGSLPD